MGGPAEPHEPRGEGAGRPRDDDENFGYNDPAFDEDPDRTRRRRPYSDGPGFNPDAGFSPDAGYSEDAGYARSSSYRDGGYDDGGDEYEPPIFTEEELEGLGPEGGGGGPRRVLPLEDEPTTLVARYLFPTERYRGEWKRHWIHLTTPLSIGAGATLLLGYLAGFLTRQNINGLVTVAVLIWLGVISWVAWKVFDWYFDRFILTNKRVMVVNGIITRKVAMMPLLRVTDMKYEQTALGRMLSYGTFVLESAGQDQALREVKHLPNPNELYLRVVEEMYEPQAVEARLGKDSDGDDA
ncbi:PH domain-containing protein [Actinoplanes bogorensis]|uniref:PH domain-containing protein n=1 Tax=Paractinoplanes bogorensis TaxID=1610840 RepID=A0ABS5YHQ9_9ACTN|nr:PH domain-containing protein [Actinoplanes bogorensis]MBU2663014.1 PH domain-containing protein [Actinoplanes bogorensis]